MKPRGRWIAHAAVAAVVVAGVGLAVTLKGNAGATSYSVREAGIGDVTEQVAAVGTVEATNQADANFGVSGTVTSVEVAVGDQVSAGQTLAALDFTSFEVAVQQAQANLAVAEAQLESAESAATSTTTTSTTTSSPCSSTGSTGPTSSTGSTGSTGPTGPTGPTGSTGSTGSGPTGSTGSGPKQVGQSGSTTTSPTSTSTTTTMLGPINSSSSCSNENSGRGSSSSGSSRMGDQGSGAAGANSNPLSQVYRDKASLYEDQGDLDTAEQNLAAATLKAPISGTVYQVGIATGDHVSSGLSEAISTVSAAASGSSGSSAAVKIVDTGGYDVVCDVSSTDIAEMSYGDSAVTTLASGGQVNGVVTSIADTPMSSNGTTYFPVEVTVEGEHGPLNSGTNADVEIMVAHRQDVLSVPTSAVHTDGRTASVSLLVDGHVVHRRVRVGVAGPVRTQITSGLEAGQQVVLANENQPIPSSTVTGGPGGGAFSQTVIVGGGPGAIRKVVGGG